MAGAATTSTNGVSATSFAVPTASASPKGITAGIDGSLWFTESAGNKIGRISTSGQINEFALPTANAVPVAIAQGADGNLWFTESAASRIGRITPSGAITEFAVTTANSQPLDIAPGPDGNLWFTEAAANRIGRITTTGSVTEFAVPTASSSPTGITAAADGNLYFTEASASKIGRITTAGTIAEQAVTSSGGAGVGPNLITTGPDNAVWFTEPTVNGIGRMDPQGHVTQVPLPTFNSGPAGITTGVDGAIWYAESTANAIGQLVTPYDNVPVGGGSNQPIDYALPSAGRTPTGIAFGPDGNAWITDSASNAVVRLVAPHAAKEFASQIPAGAWVTGLTSGPDGAVWFTTACDVNRLSRDGAVTMYPTGGCASGSTQGFTTNGGIITGPDGRLWFDTTGTSANCVDSMTTTGSVTTIACPSGQAEDMTKGADGNVWVYGGTGTGPYQGDLVRITASGAVTTFPVTTCTPNPCDFAGLAAGPDGNIWYEDYTHQTIGRITTAGTVLPSYPSPTSDPGRITAGPDGNVWFTGVVDSHIFRMTPSGVVTTFSTPNSFSEPTGIAAGPDGNIWVTETYVNKIARVTPAGQFTEYPISTGGAGYTTNTAYATAVAHGSDGYMYFSEYYGQKIGRVPVTSFPVNVLVKDNTFIDGSPTLSLGTVVDWSNYGPRPHSVADASGMGLFNSGALSGWSQFEFAFSYAGTYSYNDSVSGPAMMGSVAVPMVASPGSGTASTSFTLTWAQISPPPGYVFDIQIDKPGATSFTKYLTGTTTLSQSFVPKNGAGSYQFRARLRNTKNKKTSQWSPSLSIVVT